MGAPIASLYYNLNQLIMKSFILLVLLMLSSIVVEAQSLFSERAMEIMGKIQNGIPATEEEAAILQKEFQNLGFQNVEYEVPKDSIGIYFWQNNKFKPMGGVSYLGENAKKLLTGEELSDIDHELLAFIPTGKGVGEDERVTTNIGYPGSTSEFHSKGSAKFLMCFGDCIELLMDPSTKSDFMRFSQFTKEFSPENFKVSKFKIEDNTRFLARGETSDLQLVEATAKFLDEYRSTEILRDENFNLIIGTRPQQYSQKVEKAIELYGGAQREMFEDTINNNANVTISISQLRKGVYEVTITGAPGEYCLYKNIDLNSDLMPHSMGMSTNGIPPLVFDFTIE